MKSSTFLKANVIAPAVAIVTVAGFLFYVLVAQAAVTPTVTTVIHNGSHGVVGSALIGTAVHANASVASSTASTSPTGTVDFQLYNGTTCSGAVTAQNGVALVNGVAESATTTIPVGGLSYRAHYNGQTDIYTGSDSNCVAITANQFSPTITNTLSATSVVVGSSVYDTASLSNVSANASGTVTYRIYSDNSCTTLWQTAGAKIVTNGSVPNSDSVQFNSVGTYYWQAVYAGDTTNGNATTSCAAGILSVTATTTPPTPGTGSIVGTVYHDQNKNDSKDAGEPGLAGWTVWLHKVSTTTSWWNKHFKKSGYNAPIVMTATTDASGNYSFGNLAAGTYFVEESVMKGWKQTSDDMKVTLAADNSGSRVDFSNVEKKNKNDKGNKGKKWDKDVKDDQNDDDDHDNGKSGKWNQNSVNVKSWLKLSLR